MSKWSLNLVPAPKPSSGLYTGRETGSLFVKAAGSANYICVVSSDPTIEVGRSYYPAPASHFDAIPNGSFIEITTA